MNKPRKVIWTVYLMVLSLLFLRLMGPHKSPYYPYEDDQFWAFLFLGWIPALILHFIWRNKKNDEKNKKGE